MGFHKGERTQPAAAGLITGFEEPGDLLRRQADIALVMNGGPFHVLRIHGIDNQAETALAVVDHALQ